MKNFFEKHKITAPVIAAVSIVALTALTVFAGPTAPPTGGNVDATFNSVTAGNGATAPTTGGTFTGSSYGVQGTATGASAIGVQGNASGATSYGGKFQGGLIGVEGNAPTAIFGIGGSAVGGVGVRGDAGGANTWGVLGHTSQNNSTAVYGEVVSGTTGANAGYFDNLNGNTVKLGTDSYSLDSSTTTPGSQGSAEFLNTVNNSTVILGSSTNAVYATGKSQGASITGSSYGVIGNATGSGGTGGSFTGAGYGIFAVNTTPGTDAAGAFSGTAVGVTANASDATGTGGSFYAKGTGLKGWTGTGGIGGEFFTTNGGGSVLLGTDNYAFGILPPVGWFPNTPLLAIDYTGALFNGDTSGSPVNGGMVTVNNAKGFQVENGVKPTPASVFSVDGSGNVLVQGSISNTSSQKNTSSFADPKDVYDDCTKNGQSVYYDGTNLYCTTPIKIAQKGIDLDGGDIINTVTNSPIIFSSNAGVILEGTNGGQVDFQADGTDNGGTGVDKIWNEGGGAIDLGLGDDIDIGSSGGSPQIKLSGGSGHIQAQGGLGQYYTGTGGSGSCTGNGCHPTASSSCNGGDTVISCGFWTSTWSSIINDNDVSGNGCYVDGTNTSASTLTITSYPYCLNSKK